MDVALITNETELVNDAVPVGQRVEAIALSIEEAFEASHLSCAKHQIKGKKLDGMATKSSMTLHDGHKPAYKCIGDESKPLLLFVAGSSGLGFVFARLAQCLSTHFQCVYYNKRGFTPTDKASDESFQYKYNPVVTPQQHADDAASLIKHLSPSQPAFVFGTSLGGTAVLDLTIRYPELVNTAILHEPITISAVRDSKERAAYSAMYQQVGSMVDDPLEAYRIFDEYMYQSSEDDQDDAVHTTQAPRRPISPGPALLHNLRQSVCEAAPIASYVVDEQAARKLAEKFVIVCGTGSVYQKVSKPGQALVAIFGEHKQLWRLAGDHNSFLGKKHAEQFGREILEVLAKESRWTKDEGRNQSRL